MDKTVAAWFRGKVDFISENLDRLSKYKVVPETVKKALKDAMYSCNKASATLLQLEGKKSAPGYSGCFIGQSVVSTPHVMVPVLMQDLKPGRTVLGWDTEKDCFTTPKVKRITLSQTDTVFTFELIDERGRSSMTSCSPKQRFFTKEGFVEAQELTKESKLLNLLSTAHPTLLVVATITKQENMEEVVYGVELEDGPRTFFVDGALAHNIKV